MNLSHKLTFSIFSVLLVTVLAFAATPAMAIVEVNVEGDYLDTTLETGVVVTITYSVNANPKPTKADFKDDTNNALNGSNYHVHRSYAKTFTLTDSETKFYCFCFEWLYLRNSK